MPRQSGEGAVAVDEAAISRGEDQLSQLEGLFHAPETGACVAALEVLVKRGEVGKNDRVVIFGTGSGLKYL